MTSHELARKLLELPDVMVTVNGYEGGVNEITAVSGPEELILEVNEDWFYGKHEYAQYESEHEGKKRVNAIHIS